MMKLSVSNSRLLVIIALGFLASCKTTVPTANRQNSVQAELDLINVKDDKVAVTVASPRIKSDKITFRMPRIIPGTYAIADYGRYVESFEARDVNGQLLKVEHPEVNSWVISDASKLASVRYWVNDTYDNEGGSAFAEGSETIFSPAGTNILAGQNFVLNMAGFVGYFEGFEELSYELRISHPADLQAATSMVDMDKASTTDRFSVKRYAEVVDHPVMYSRPDFATARIGDMDLLLSVYSPRKKNISAYTLFPGLEEMMRAQKAYLGDINKTSRYAVLAYITTNEKDDAKGIGALEHNTSTTSVFMETMTLNDLIHVISHEFFHTLTPLNVHSREIQYFDFTNPKMSAHLWMYEGFTEYFAQHFQVHQGLMNEEKFLDAMAEKIRNSRSYFQDSLSFLHMSKNVLDPKMKAQYPNVYQKGALMAMCLDIILREQSGGKTGLLHFMKELSAKYGPDKPFEDDKLIEEVSSMMGKEAAAFLDAHVVNGSPVDYDKYLARVGCLPATIKVPSLSVFLKGMKPLVAIDTFQKKIIVTAEEGESEFFQAFGVKKGDELVSFNGELLGSKSPSEVLIAGAGVAEDSEVKLQVRRDGKLMDLLGTAILNKVDGAGYRFSDAAKATLKEAWLKK